MKELRVLFVEDSATDAELITWQLQNGGFTLTRRDRVQTREGLRAALEKETWDIVIGDYSMPEFTGLEALSVVREFSLDLPFLMVSGTVGEDLAVAAMRAGANDFLVKDNLQRLAPAVTRELRERKSRDEKEATQKALRLTQLSLDHTSDLLLWIREDGGVLLANATASRVLGYSKRELMDMKYWHLDPTFTPERFATMWNDARARNNCSMESALRTKAGATIETEMACNFVPFAGDACILILVRDVTEKKKAESDLRSSEEQLRQAQRMESVGRLAGGIAHDFNNILSVVSGYASLLQMKLAKTGAAYKELVEIDKAVVRATSLVRQLLTFSRKQVVQPQVLDLCAVARESLSMLKMMLGEDVVVETRLHPAGGKVKADRTQVEQIIMNLAVNARDAMPKGGSLIIEVFPERLEAGRMPEGEKIEPGEYVRLSIRDTGHGMDEGTLSRIFEPFFTTKGEGQGTGLGLSTVYGIVKQAGGFIRVESAPGAGSIFSIHLPATAETEDDEAFEVTHGLRILQSRGETVLLAEDDTALRKLTKDILVMEGYKVLEAQNANEAMGFAKARDLEINLLLTDLIMPHMNGKELAEAVWAQRPDLRVLFMSGYAPETLAPQAGWLSEHNFLAKPFPPGKLVAKIRAVLDAPPAERDRAAMPEANPDAPLIPRSDP